MNMERELAEFKASVVRAALARRFQQLSVDSTELVQHIRAGASMETLYREYEARHNQAQSAEQSDVPRTSGLQAFMKRLWQFASEFAKRAWSQSRGQ